VRVRALLARGIDARTDVLDEIRGFAEAAIGAHRQHAYAAAHEVGDEHMTALAVDHDVARIGSVR
jgi:hypothetical protein